MPDRFVINVRSPGTFEVSGDAFADAARPLLAAAGFTDVTRDEFNQLLIRVAIDDEDLAQAIETAMHQVETALAPLDLRLAFVADAASR